MLVVELAQMLERRDRGSQRGGLAGRQLVDELRAWIIVGVAAVPSAALWAGLSRIWSRPTMLAVALGAQAVGIALPALVGGTTAPLAAAVLFGGTFLGVATVALATGAYLRTPRAVAILTTGYSVTSDPYPAGYGPPNDGRR